MDDILKWQGLIDEAIKTWGSCVAQDSRDDLRQECFLLVVQRADELGSLDELSAKRTAVTWFRLAIQDFAEKASRYEPITDDAAVGPQGGLPSGLSEEDKEHILLAVHKLPATEQYVIGQYFYEGRTEAEIGISLGKPAMSVRQIKKLALKKLNTLLKGKNDGTH